MDIAYDHIQEETLSPEEASQRDGAASTKQQSLNTEFQQAYKAISSSPWGARFGALMGTVKKQGETYYEGARQEYTAASVQAARGFTDLRSNIINRTRSLSLNKSGPGLENTPLSTAEGNTEETEVEKPSIKSEIDGESESVLSRLRLEAAKRLKDIEKAEDAADEALLKFGTNIFNFLREAVTIAPPAEGVDKDKVLFESKGEDGKRVIHTTRFDAQLHVIHSSLDSFSQDPASAEYAGWAEKFSAESKAPQITADLAKYKELRLAVSRLVPEKVSLEDFWKRYYFLRHVIETDEQRRKDMLEGANTADEEVAWDEDSDEEAQGSNAKKVSIVKHPSSMGSTITLTQESGSTLKPVQPRKSNDQNSQPDSEASYDVVGERSGAPSHAPESPKVEVSKEESDEEDWE
ncbi:MAG: hypothetical protein M1829_005031 [Trizodia sp. TS-e1964]|nr:MAG: hypothetical protein M1829_005031 [Trizodia sp. TS-e1964]